MKCEICGKTVHIWQTPFLSVGKYTHGHKKCLELYNLINKIIREEKQ